MAYVKQTWVNGDIITADKLNHMEDGIEDAENIPVVVANPTLAGTESALNGLQVGDTKYSVGGGGSLEIIHATLGDPVEGQEGAFNLIVEETIEDIMAMTMPVLAVDATSIESGMTIFFYNSTFSKGENQAIISYGEIAVFRGYPFYAVITISNNILTGTFIVDTSES